MLKTISGFLVFMALISFGCGGGGDDDDGGDGSGDVDKNSSSKATPTTEQLEAIVNTAIPGFTAVEPRTTPFGATVTYISDAKTAGDAQVAALVSVAVCDPFICATQDKDAYSSPEAQRNLKSTLSKSHIENPDLQWEFGEVELAASVTGLYTYALSYLESKDSSGGTTRLSADAYRVWYHDGRVFISMDVFSRGGPSARSVADLESAMSKADAEKAAKDIYAALKPALSGK